MAKISQELNDILNKQIGLEIYNSNVYRQISALFDDKKLVNVSKFFKDWSAEEIGHANIFQDFLESRVGSKVNVPSIQGLDGLNISSINDIGELVMRLEAQTTDDITKIYNLSEDLGDLMGKTLALKMITEQIEEENKSDFINQQLTMVTDYILWDANFKSPYGG